MALGWVWWRAWSPLVARDAAALCVAGVALGDIHLRSPRHFARQAWHLVTSTFVFAWQAWHLWRWAGSGGALAWLLFIARGAAALCAAGVAFGDVDLHLRGRSTFVLSGRRGPCGTGLGLVARLVAVGRPECRGTLRGRRGTWRHPPTSFGVAGVALGDINLRFAWQAGWVWWRAWSPLVARGLGTLRGSREGDVYLCCAWQAWRLAASTFVLRGRRDTW